jgi:hypothetical protein
MYGRMDLEIHVFLTSALLVGEWSASSPCRFTPAKESTRRQSDRRLDVLYVTNLSKIFKSIHFWEQHYEMGVRRWAVIVDSTSETRDLLAGSSSSGGGFSSTVGGRVTRC